MRLINEKLSYYEKQFIKSRRKTPSFSYGECQTILPSNKEYKGCFRCDITDVEHRLNTSGALLIMITIKNLFTILKESDKRGKDALILPFT